MSKIYLKIWLYLSHASILKIATEVIQFLWLVLTTRIPTPFTLIPI